MKMWRQIITTVLVFASHGLAQGLDPLDARDPMERLEIHMVYVPRPNTDPPDAVELRNTLASTCRRIGQPLAQRKGLLGSGPFLRVRCTPRSKPPTQLPAGWHLVVLDGPERISLELQYQDASAENPPEMRRRLELPASDFFSRMLERPDYQALLGIALASHLPGPFRLDTADSIKRPAGIWPESIEKGLPLGAKIPALPPIPNELRAFYLERRNRFWIATHAGVWTQPKRPNGRWTLRQGTDESPPALQREGPVFAHFPEFARASWADLDKPLTLLHQYYHRALDPSLTAVLKRTLVGETAAGYIGYRFGLPDLQGDSAISATRLHSFFAEIRSGLFSGLRIYYDLVPRATRDSSSIEWNRLILGTSLGFNPGFLVERVDITPKIGQWSFRYRGPADPNTPELVTTFDIQNKLSLAIELGIEKHLPKTVLRGWVAQDRAIDIGSVAAQSVSSTRMGADFFWSGLQPFGEDESSLRTTLLVFGFFEQVTLRAPDSPSQEASDETQVEAAIGTELAYTGGYMGIGAGISW